MKVAVIASDLGGSGHYRAKWPADAVATLTGWDVQTYRPDEVQVDCDHTGRVIDTSLEHHDLVVLQRPDTYEMCSAILHWQSQGTAVCVDIDDALWCIDEDNVAHPTWNSGTGKHWGHTEHAASIADHVTVSTSFLADRYDGQVITNAVPDKVFDIEPKRGHDRPVIGWPAFAATHPHDAEIVRDAMRAHKGRYDYLGIGDAAGQSAALGLDWDEAIDYGDARLGKPYFHALGLLDIGLVPLADTAFNQGKSALKVLELAAMGCAVIATPTEAVIDLDAVPLLQPLTAQGWTSTLDHLLSGPERATRIGQRARQAVYDFHRMSLRAHDWAVAWETAAS